MQCWADSEFYKKCTIGTVLRAGVDASATVWMNSAVNVAIATTENDEWMIQYPNAILDGTIAPRIAKAEVDDAPFAMFRPGKMTVRCEGHAVVRRTTKLNSIQVHWPMLFYTCRHRAFFTNADEDDMSSVVAESTHLGHASIELVHAGLMDEPNASLPSGWWPPKAPVWSSLSITFNLARTAGFVADYASQLATAKTAMIRRTFIHVPAQLARLAGRSSLHLPQSRP